MQQNKARLLSLAVLMLLAGCTPAAGQPAAPTAAPSAPAQAAASTQAAADPAAASGTLYKLPWIYSACNTDDAYYEIAPCGFQGNAGLVLKTDYATGQQTCVCQKPGCAHNSADCPAYLPMKFSHSLYVVGDTIYIAYWGNYDNTRQVRYPPMKEGDAAAEEYEQAYYEESCLPAYLDTISADGTTRTRLLTAPDNTMLQFACCDGTALYGTQDTLVDPDHFGRQITGLRVELATGAASNFELPPTSQIQGCSGDQLLIARTVSEEPLDMNSPSYDANYQNARQEYDLYGVGTGEVRKVLDFATWEAYTLIGAFGGTMYYGLFDESYFVSEVKAIDLATGAERTVAQMPSTVRGVVSLDDDPPAGSKRTLPYLRVQDYVEETDQEKPGLLDLRDGSYHPITQPTGYVYSKTVCAVTGDGRLLVEIDGMPGTMPETGNGRNAYALIDAESYLNGSTDWQTVEMFETEYLG